MNKNDYKIILGIVFIIFIVSFIAFFSYHNFMDIKKSNNNNVLTPTKIEELGKEKFNLIYSMHNYLTDDFIYFKDKDIDIYNIDNQDILSTLYSLLSNDDKNKTGSADNDCFLDKGVYTKDNYPNNCYTESFDKALLEEQLNNNFDSNLKVDYTDFFSTGSNQCFINNNVYNCYLNRANSKFNNYITLIDYDYSILNDNQLEVYSYLITIRTSDSDGYTKGIYSDYNASNKIDDLKYYEEELERVLNISNIKKIIEKYRKQITKYKSIFIKENNNYVWNSTKIEK